MKINTSYRNWADFNRSRSNDISAEVQSAWLRRGTFMNINEATCKPIDKSL
jgi:hypothetical protein